KRTRTRVPTQAEQAQFEADTDTLISSTGSDFLDGQEGNDTYIINLRGGQAASFVNVYDSGADANWTDFMQVFGTLYSDTFLLRRSSASTGLAFVALINPDPHTERINYWNQNGVGIDRLLVTGSFGDDHFYVDDVNAEATLTGDDGQDTFQVGQLYRS